MGKKLVSKEKVVTEFKLLLSKLQSNKLHLQELQAKRARLNKSISDLDQKIKQQESKLKEIQAKYPDYFTNQT